MSIFKLDKVAYKYNAASGNVFENVSYEFEKGKTYAIVGKSGTGKSTLLSLMAGLEKETSGNIFFDGKSIRKINKDKYRSKLVGVIFQSFNLLPHLTAVENVILSMDISGIKVKNRKEYALDMLSKVGIDGVKANRRILKLSGGEQQRVAIARTLAFNPDVILADEPTGNLDKANEQEIVKIFKKLAKEDNKSVIIVTHSENLSEHVDKVYDLELYKVKK